MPEIEDKKKIEIYLKDIEKNGNLSKKTITQRRALLEVFAPAMPDGEIQEKDILKFYNDLGDKMTVFNRGLAKTTIYQYKNAINKFLGWYDGRFETENNLKWGVDDSIINQNLRRLKLLMQVSVPKGVGIIIEHNEKISIADFQKIMASPDIPLYKKELYYILAYFGLRRNAELYPLLISTEGTKQNDCWLNLPKKILHIGKTKTEAGRRELFFDDYTEKVLLDFIQNFRFKLNYSVGNPEKTKKFIKLSNPYLSEKQRAQKFSNKVYHLCKELEKKYSVLNATNPHAFRGLFCTEMGISICHSEIKFPDGCEMSSNQLYMVLEGKFMGHSIDKTKDAYFSSHTESLRQLWLLRHYFLKYNIKIPELP
ncbi:MAG: hypothetical protein BWK75_02020 [Candidatus Altiarchaeales archaeon A3]|nr:MAG: hypothetical protein BWK75_02020 [Candidatus Altiarchaeales archaeon A3]